MTWRDYLTPEEKERLSQLKTEAKDASRERLRIRKRAWKRMERAA